MFYDAKNSFCRSLELISKQTMPVRLKLAKLSKKLVAVEERWEKNCAVTDVDAVDPVEIKLENQVLIMITETDQGISITLTYLLSDANMIERKFNFIINIRYIFLKISIFSMWYFKSLLT